MDRNESNNGSGAGTFDAGEDRVAVPDSSPPGDLQHDSAPLEEEIPQTQPRTSALSAFDPAHHRDSDPFAGANGQFDSDHLEQHVAADCNGALLHDNGEANIDLAKIPELAPLVAGDAELAMIEPQPPAPEFDVPPPNGGDTGSSSGFNEDDNSPSHDKELDLFGHLAELRARILRCVLAIGLFTVITWNFGAQIQAVFMRPIRAALSQAGPGNEIVVLRPMDGFMLYFQICMISAVLLVMPYILYEMWCFVEPALTRRERRFTMVLVPFSLLLFVAGVTLGYVISPLFFSFFLQFMPPGARATLAVGESSAFLAKMLLVFGICFQVPVVTIFINKIGLVSRNWLIEYWRHVVVVIFIVVSIITPTWDPLTLIACAVPPCLLYGLSLWMVKWL